MPTVLDDPIAATAKSPAGADQIERKYAEAMKLNYPMELVKEGDQFTASYPDLPGCASFGDTPDEAVTELEAVRALWVRGQLEGGNSIPLPSSYEDKFSGKFVIRIPKDLHRLLHLEAGQQGVSLNQYVNYALANRNSTRSNIEVDYSRITEELLSKVHGLISLKRMYSGHAIEAAREFYLQALPSNFERIGLLGRPRSYRSSPKASTALSKRNYREAHIGY
jgi:predicted RNase H-like HicB family nuclease